MKRYNPSEIEPKWQKIWADSKLYEVSEDPKKEKKYITAMFPYPSGAGLHVGHVRNYSITDTVARFHRQRGYNVLTTIGWDAFGLPAENYAIKTGTPPAVSTHQNIDNFKRQLQRIGMSYDWSRELSTDDPKYYKWTQWIFTQLFEKGLAYQAENLQWWCNLCQTVLANEQVVNGCCWRHEDTPVVKKRTTQWFFKITDYADKLLDATEDLEWPEKIKAMQRNWIGRSKGAEIEFDIDGGDGKVNVFTTRADTLFGATFLVLAPEHQMVEDLAADDQKSKVQAYVAEAQRRSDVERMEENREKTGVFTGSYAINPVTNEKIPIWVADYVLTGYGTGAIMAVPGHDQRDYDFAKKFDLKVVEVYSKPDDFDGECYSGEGTIKNSGKYDGLSTADAREKIVADLAKKGVAREKVNYRMRDWLISRQRYWGAPIPIIHCPEHGAVAVPKKDLPVELPDVDSWAPSGDGRSALARVEDWVNTTCPICNKPAKRETDTMDGYACSSWYYLRYTDAKNDERAWDPAKANYWLPIDYYCGGDHAVSHLLYSRFWMRFFAEQGLVDERVKEPVKRLVFNGYIFAHDGTKMSKSKGNVVDPMELVEQGYGADSLRLYELFIAPFELDAAWDPRGITGTYRFIARVWALVYEVLATGVDRQSQTGNIQLDRAINKAIKKVTTDLHDLSFNTAIAALMELTNDLYKLRSEVPISGNSAAWRAAVSTLVQILAPFAPHVAEELWQQLGNEQSVHISGWPVWDDALLVSDVVTIVVQVNGKVRTSIEMPADATEKDVTETALADERIKQYTEGGEPKRVVYVPGKLLNIVV